MWPESLVREIVEKRCVIHVGSGMSCQSVDESGDRPPSWPKLLQELKDHTLADISVTTQINEFISEKRYLDAAELIRIKGRAAEFNSRIKQIFVGKNYIPSECHSLLVDIAPKIFVTTNYDTLLEGALISESGHNSYTQYEHTRDGLLDALRSPSTILIKLHGCAKYPNDVVLSRSDYFRLRKRHGAFFDLVSAIYKLNTVLFIGCGIEDPDINLILENNNIQAEASNPSYAMVGSLSYAAKLKDTIKSQYNIELIIYQQQNPDDHSFFASAIKALAEQVTIVRTKYSYPA